MLSNCGAGEDSWVPWTARSNQSILKKINHEYSLEWLKLNRVRVNLLEAPIHWPPDAKSRFTEKKTLMLGKTESRGRRGQQRMRRLNGITNTMDMNLSKLQETVKNREAWWAAVQGATKSKTQLSNWTKTTIPSNNIWEYDIFFPGVFWNWPQYSV